ncbi:uncharacterized protein L3040_007423 [Drepanopeziza brunnea f. sp. 'multigermtubi']|uniref:uncharacterized protein n=1 Tax=Drepanopeziza brunnea f. sp. 'multigermtubi' TaxID=698441 RepID=UPI002386AEE4|nr:hypothetical protein L3040_007423 [Drepanopeziza brunnea f. sp. 'multigermtubi']
MAPQRRAAAKAQEQIRRLAAAATTAVEDEDEDQESESGCEGELATGTGTGNGSNNSNGNPQARTDAAAALPPASGPAPSISENPISRNPISRTPTRSRKQNRKQKRRAASSFLIDQSEDDSDGDYEDGLKFRPAPVADHHRNQVAVAVALPPALVPPPTVNPSEQSTAFEQEPLLPTSTSTSTPQLPAIMENLKIDAPGTLPSTRQVSSASCPPLQVAEASRPSKPSQQFQQPQPQASLQPTVLIPQPEEEEEKEEAAEPEIDWRDDDPGFFADAFAAYEAAHPKGREFGNDPGYFTEALAEYEAANPEYRGFEENDDDEFHLPNIDQLSPREDQMANQMAHPEAQGFGDDGFPLPNIDQLSPREDHMANQMAPPEAQESEESVNFEDFLAFEDDDYYYPSIDQLLAHQEANRDVPSQSPGPVQAQAESGFGFRIIHPAPPPLDREVEEEEEEEEDKTVDPSHLRNDRAYRLPIWRKPSKDALTLAATRLAVLTDKPDQTDEEKERLRLTHSLTLNLERIQDAKDNELLDEVLNTQSQLQPQPQPQPQSQPQLQPQSQPQPQLQPSQPPKNLAIALNMLSIVGSREPDPQPFGPGRRRVRLRDKEDLGLCDFCFFESPSGINNTRVWLPIEASAGFCNDCSYAPNTAAQELWQWQARELPGRSSGGQRATDQDNSAQSIVPPLPTSGEEQKFHQEALNEMRSERRTERIKAHRMALAMSRDPNGAQAPLQSGHDAIQAAKPPTKAAPIKNRSAPTPNTLMGNMILQPLPDMGPMRNRSPQRVPDMGPTVNFPSQYPPLSSTAGPAGNATYDMTFTMPNRPQSPIPGVHEPHHKTLGDRMPPTTPNSDMGGGAPSARAVNLQQAPAAYFGSKGPNFCRGFPYRQVDFTKAKICTYCKELKTFIMNHHHHTAFTPLNQVLGLATGHLMYQGLGRIENGVEVHDGRWKHCMICTELAVYGCDSCPLRLCVGCQVYLTRTCKLDRTSSSPLT